MEKKVYGTIVKVDPKVKGSAPITEEALRFIKKHTHGSTVLEIGCGSGIYAIFL
jgi:ribosomal protein L11 methylase PrmA